MPKPIIRFTSAHLDLHPGVLGVIVRAVPIKTPMYLNIIVQLNFDDEGSIIRIETEENIYVQVK